MDKRKKIILVAYICVYVLALLLFHATYSYTTYWVEESSIIILASLVYVAIGIGLFIAIKGKSSLQQISNISVKGAAKAVAYASICKAILLIIPYFSVSYFYSFLPCIYAVAWIAISVFFFTLHKNMQ